VTPPLGPIRPTLKFLHSTVLPERWNADYVQRWWEKMKNNRAVISHWLVI